MQTPFVLFLGDIGGSELILIMVVILVFFGANKIPELARGLGKGIREFKDASSEIRSEFERAGQQPQNPNPYGPPAQQYAQQPQPYPAAQPHNPYDTLPHTPHVPEANVTMAHPVTDVPYVAPTLPPNLAPEGTQPRQPYIPSTPDPA
jgi:sec-independent protein translocase protein TatA